MSDHFNSQPPFAPKGSRVFYVADGYSKARQQIEAELKSTGHVPGGHGGLWDTAETMAVRLDAVRPSEFRPGTLTNDGNGPPIRRRPKRRVVKAACAVIRI
jgi:creatinine amidohydrolase